MDTYSIQKFYRILQSSRNLCVFTGAGISVPSGIPDFRSADGLYNRESGLSVPPEQIISRSFFDAHPTEFYSYYKKNMLFLDAKPNEAHRYFAALESPARSVSVVTQNIDGLHTAAGSTAVCTAISVCAAKNDMMHALLRKARACRIARAAVL